MRKEPTTCTRAQWPTGVRIASPSLAPARFTARLMHSSMEFGVDHLQNAEVVGIFHSLLQCVSLFLEAGWGEWTFPLGKKKQILWYKVRCSSSGGHVSMVDIDWLWHRIWLKFKLKLEKYLYECLVGRSDKAKVKELRDHKSWVAAEKLCQGQGCGSWVRNCKKLRKNPSPKNTANGKVQESNRFPPKQLATKFLQRNLQVGKGCCVCCNVCVNKCFPSFSGQVWKPQSWKWEKNIWIWTFLQLQGLDCVWVWSRLFHGWSRGNFLWRK